MLSCDASESIRSFCGYFPIFIPPYLKNYIPFILPVELELNSLLIFRLLSIVSTGFATHMKKRVFVWFALYFLGFMSG
jgi:hypothetical protein